MQGSRGSKKGTSVFHGMEPPQGCTLLIWDTIISYVSDKSIDLIRYIDQSDERDRRFVRVHHMKKTIWIDKAKKLPSPLWLRHKKKSWSHTWIGMWSKDSRHRIELHRFIKFYIHLFTSNIISLFYIKISWYLRPVIKNKLSSSLYLSISKSFFISER